MSEYVATRVVLVANDRRLYDLCWEILREHQPANYQLVVAEPQSPLPDGEIYIWDYRPGMELARQLASERPEAHLLLVDRSDIAESRGENLPAAMVVLKPVTKAPLAAWIEHALGSLGTESAARLRRDRDDMLQALMETNLRLQEYDRDRTNFLARAIHDFRAPLTATSGYCGLLLAEQLGSLTDAQKEVLSRVQLSLKRLTRMTSAMFQLSIRPEIQRVPNLERGDIRESIEQALHEAGPFAVEKRIQVSVSLTPPPEPMYFEREPLEQVTLNLLDNACKFTPKNGHIEVVGYPYFWERRSGRVRVAVEKERRVWKGGAPNAYRVDVRNTGPAIPQERLDRIFEEYATFDSGQSPFGSGLGLAICKLIIQQHKGRIWAGNHPEGAVLSFIVPFTPEGSESIAGSTRVDTYQAKGASL